MTSTLSPPPYTLHDMWCGRYAPTQEPWLLRRHLLHVFVVTSDADREKFRKLLSKNRYQPNDDELTHPLNLLVILRCAVELSKSDAQTQLLAKVLKPPRARFSLLSIGFGTMLSMQTISRRMNELGTARGDRSNTSHTSFNRSC